MKQRGFTLLELLLYIGTVAIVLLIIAQLLFTILQSRVKNQTIAEVEQQGLQVMQIITQTIRNADSVGEPAVGISSNELELVMTNPAVNPTIFDLNVGSIRIKESAGSFVALTSSRVTASALNFQNLSNSIKIQFTLTHINPGSRNEYDYSKVFYGTANVRK